jgi:hypothetical protein
MPDPGESLEPDDYDRDIRQRSLHDINGAVENVPDLTAPAPRPEALQMTGMDATVTQSAALSIEVASHDSTQVEYWHNTAPVAQLDRASVYGTEG